MRLRLRLPFREVAGVPCRGSPQHPSDDQEDAQEEEGNAAVDPRQRRPSEEVPISGHASPISIMTPGPTLPPRERTGDEDAPGPLMVHAPRPPGGGLRIPARAGPSRRCPPEAKP